MLEELNRFGVLLFRGSILIAALLWVLIDEAANRLFYDQRLSAGMLQISDVHWSVEDGAVDDKRFPIEVIYQNRSPLRIRKLSAVYRVEDCPTGEAHPVNCVLVIEETRTTELDTPAGLPGRYSVELSAPRMAHPIGTLRLTVTVRALTGQTDETLAGNYDQH